MSAQKITCCLRSQSWLLLLLVMSILLIEVGGGCAQTHTGESKVSSPLSFSVYALSRGKGVPVQARQVLDHAREVLKVGQEEGEVKRLVDRRIGLEGETRLCAEFFDEQVADRFFKRLRSLSLGVDLVNMKKETCPS